MEIVSEVWNDKSLHYVHHNLKEDSHEEIKCWIVTATNKLPSELTMTREQWFYLHQGLYALWDHTV